MVADWDVNNRELKVSFIEAVANTTRFTLSGELALPRDGKLNVPLIRLPSVERETGGVGIEVLGAGEIKERQSSGLEEAEAGELGQLIASRPSPSLIAFRLNPADGKSDRSLSLTVARYTPQAVLTANIEEAEYNALFAEDGKLLVQSRFAVRNNQRNFLKLTLPPTAVLWSASVAGRPIRPGRAPDGSLLLPLEKSRSGEEAPAFVVEIVVYRSRSGVDRQRPHATLARRSRSADLEVATAVASPAAVSSDAGGGDVRKFPRRHLRRAGIRRVACQRGRRAAAPQSHHEEQPAMETKQLVSKLPPTKQSARPARNLPLRLVFPHFGPSIFLVSELTSENQTPAVEFDFSRDRKRGEK